MMSVPNHDEAIRYRGFLVLPQRNNTWLVRPERSPMLLLPFRTNSCSIKEVKETIDLKLLKTANKRKSDDFLDQAA